MKLAARISVVVGILVGSVTFAVTPVGVPKAAVPPLSDASLRKQKWSTRAVFEDYDRVGTRNPKWDATARTLLKETADMWSLPRVRGAGNLEIYNLCQKAVAEGCDDPMVSYAYARTYQTFGDDPAKVLELHRIAADRLAKSGYTTFYKVLSRLRASQIQMEQWLRAARAGNNDGDAYRTGMGWAKLAVDQLPELAKDKDLPIDNWTTLGEAVDAIFANTKDGRKTVIEHILPAFEKHAPKTAALAIKGHLYVKYAWDARGGGFAHTVNEESWQGMRERLDTAEKALEEAWAADNTNAYAATKMITVELGQGKGRDRMEMWFERAMQADPDYEEACHAKLYYLEPKWYGTPRDMIAFGRECLKGGRWNSQVPEVLMRAHAHLSHYTRGGYAQQQDPAYYKLPGVWADYKAVYDGYLSSKTDASPVMYQNGYARMAWTCGALADAAAMFEKLGDAHDPRIWPREEFDAARAESLAAAAKK